MSSTPKRSRIFFSSHFASSMQSPWVMKTVCSAIGAVPVRSMWSSNADSDFLRPRTFSKGTRCPSSSTCMTGLMLSSVPAQALVFETRPPRHKNMRSSTVNQCARCSLFASVQSRTSSMSAPCSARWHACHTSSPSPPEAASVSTVSSLRCGYSSRNCFARSSVAS